MTINTLYRQEVLAEKQNRSLGKTYLVPPKVGWTFFTSSLAFVSGVCLIIFFGHYTRIEKVDGSLVPSSGLLVISSPRLGVASSTLVTLGAHVKKGDPLVRITTDQISSLGATQESISAQLKLKQSRLKSSIEEEGRLLQFQEQDFRTRQATLDAQLDRIAEQISLQSQRVVSARNLLNRWESIGEATGSVSKLQLLQQKDAMLQQEIQLKELQRQELSTNSAKSEVVSELAQAPVSALLRVNELQQQLSDVFRSLSESEAERLIILRAPSDGVVTTLLVNSGETVSAQQTLMTLLPDDAVMEAELWLPSRSVALVKSGDAVVLRYQGYPYQRYGQFNGRVADVADSATPPRDLIQFLGSENKDPRYRIRVALATQYVDADGKRNRLKPGMTLEADIVLEHRRIFDAFVEHMAGFARSNNALTH